MAILNISNHFGEIEGKFHQLGFFGDAPFLCRRHIGLKESVMYDGGCPRMNKCRLVTRHFSSETWGFARKEIAEASSEWLSGQLVAV